MTEGEMMNHELKSSIDECVLCWLATVDADGAPNVSPKEMFVHHDNGKLLIANIASPASIKNLLSNPEVCVSFIEVFKQKGFKIKGTATYIVSGDALFDDYHARLRTLGGERFPILGVIEVTIDRVDGIVAPSYWMFPDETTEDSQIKSAMQSYGVVSA